jgi:methyl-accepting chemotaxis protein
MKSISLSLKIGIGFGILTFFGLLVAGYAFWGLKTLQKVTRATELSQEFLMREIDHLNWASALQDQVRLKGSIEVQRDPTQCAFGKWYYSDSRSLIQGYFPQLAENLKSIEFPHQKLHKTADRIHELMESKQHEEAEKILYTEIRQELKAVQKNLLSVRNQMTEEIKKYGQSSEQIANQFVMIVTLLLVLSILFSLVVGYFIAKSISSSIQGVIFELSGASKHVISFSRDLKSGSVKLLNSSQSQAVSSQETAASITEIEAIAEKNAEHSGSVAGATKMAMETVETGYQKLEELIEHTAASTESGEHLLAEVQNNATELSQIVHMISEINSKVKSINEIVFQTKLLSFNASVEAARAGASGAGFSVVAEEVRKLAEMSGSVASEITQLVESSQNQVRQIISKTTEKFNSLINDNHERLQVSAQEMNQMQTLFHQIKSQVSEAADLVTEISKANQEQDVGISEISKAVRLMDSAIQEGASAIQVTTRTAEDLARESEALRIAIIHLNKIICGSSSRDSDGSACLIEAETKYKQKKQESSNAFRGKNSNGKDSAKNPLKDSLEKSSGESVLRSVSPHSSDSSSSSSLSSGFFDDEGNSAA